MSDSHMVILQEIRTDVRENKSEIANIKKRLEVEERQTLTFKTTWKTLTVVAGVVVTIIGLVKEFL